MAGPLLAAPNIAGAWQGTAHPAAGVTFRLILKITPASKGGWNASMFSIDQSAQPVPVSTMSLSGGVFQFSVAAANASYEGTVNAKGNAINGTWTGARTYPLTFERATAKTAWPTDISPHAVRFVTVEKGVKLEVLDWGGTGRPLVFLAGLGDTAHDFDKLALKFTAANHVYGITRRGYGASSKPNPRSSDYSADRLGDDVLAVMDALNLDRPVLAGHSFGGEEMSSIGNRYPEKVSGLIYLDAGYSYAFYNPGNVIPLGVNLQLSGRDVQDDLERLKALTLQDKDLAPVLQDLQAQMPMFEKDLSATQEALNAMPAPANIPLSGIDAAALNGVRKYTRIDVPILAIFADPPSLPANVTADMRAAQIAQHSAQVDAFEKGLPNARVVRLANASHTLWLTNEADVIREMMAFLADLK